MTKMFYVSPAYGSIFGRSCRGLYDNPRSWDDAIYPEDRERALGEMALRGTIVPFDVEYRIVRPDGSGRSIRSRGFPIYNDVGDIYRFAGLAEDVTEGKLLEGQVRQASKMDAIGRLASGVAHDFNNLLTVILGFAELVTADVTLADKHGKDLGEIIKAARRAAGLTKQLLAFSRQQTLHPAPRDVNGLITDITGMLGRLIGAATRSRGIGSMILSVYESAPAPGDYPFGTAPWLSVDRVSQSGPVVVHPFPYA